MIVTLISVAVTIISCYLLSKPFQISGLSLGRSFGYIIQAILLIIFIFIYNLKEKIFTSIPAKPLFDVLKIIGISTVILILGVILQKNIMFVDNIKINSILKIITIGGALVLLFTGACFYLKIPEIKIFFKKK